MNQHKLALETEKLKSMWERLHPYKLATYLRKDINDSRVYYTRKIILDYLAEKNPNDELLFEERLFRPLVNLLFKLPKSFRHKPFFIRHLLSLIYFSGAATTRRINFSKFHRSTILDIGCGAGNYYGLFVRCNLAPFLVYTGVDLAEKNIVIANQLYPHVLYPSVRFSTGNILELNFPDRVFDIVLVNDVYEHLSPAALPIALRETIRVAKDIVILNFFNEEDIPEHIIQPRLNYHWNRLSRNRILEILRINGIKDRNITIIDKYPPFNGGKPIREKDRFTGIPGAFTTMVIKISE